MEEISPLYKATYDQETRDLFLQRAYIFLWLFIVFFPLFSLLDAFAAREHFLLFLVYRLGFAFILVIFLLVLRRTDNHALTLSLILTAYLLGGLTITLMVLETGSYASSYYVGLLLITVGGFAVLPLTMKLAGIAGFCLYLTYLVPLILFSEPTSENFRLFICYSFLFFSFIVVSMIQCHEETRARIRKFNLNMNLKSMNQDLFFYTHNLEDEVVKRVRKIEESELRYEELYENILDLIVLIDRDGDILMANQHFYNTVGMNVHSLSGKSLLSVIHKDSLPAVTNEILPKLFRDEAVKDAQFVVLGRDEKPIDVECNARKILRDGKTLGFQMVIREITERKKIEKKLLEIFRLVEKSRTTAILALAKLAEFRDQDTGNHLEGIREYSRILATEMATHPSYKYYITKEYIADIHLSSVLHDIGKVGIPDNILLKPGKLTAEEFEIMKCHATYGGDTLSETEKYTTDHTFLTLGKQIAYHHHEKWDGSGYPKGLSGEEIPLSARIVALADVYDALTSKRPYRQNPFSHERAKNIIVKDSGIHFDPDVVRAFEAKEIDFQQARLNVRVT